MFATLNVILQNPLLIIGIVFIITVLSYLTVELWHIKHKTKEQKSFMMAGWGILLIVAAVIFLFTTTISFVTNSISGKAGDTFTINELKKLCTVDKLAEVNYILNKDYQQSCRIVDAVTLISYIFLVLGPIFVIFGSIIKIMDMKDNRRRPAMKVCPKCGDNISGDKCPKCGDEVKKVE